jgi:hypothetical protein
MWTAAFALCWLGIGLWVVSDGARRARVTGRAEGSAGAVIRRLTLVSRLLSLALLAFEATQLTPRLGIGFAAVALLLLAATAGSLTVVVFALWPRAYAASLPVAALVALATGGGR